MFSYFGLIMDIKKLDKNYLENFSKVLNKVREYIILFLMYVLYKIVRFIVIII